MSDVIKPGEVALPAGNFGRRTISAGNLVKSAAALSAAFSSNEEGRRHSIGNSIEAAR